MRKPYICHLLFLDFQINHYTERLKHARNFSEHLFLKQELLNLKKTFITYYN